MAIGLFCYLGVDAQEASSALDALRAAAPPEFFASFNLNPVRETDEIGREIAAEHGFEARSKFLILSNKVHDMTTREAASLLRRVFGEDDILVLFENETRI